MLGIVARSVYSIRPLRGFWVFVHDLPAAMAFRAGGSEIEYLRLACALKDDIVILFERLNFALLKRDDVIVGHTGHGSCVRWPSYDLRLGEVFAVVSLGYPSRPARTRCRHPGIVRYA